MDEGKKSSDIKAIAMGAALYTSASILGPLLLFAGLGYWLDKLSSSRILFKLIGVAVAFIFTNILLFRKVQRLNATMESFSRKSKRKIEENQKENFKKIENRIEK